MFQFHWPWLALLLPLPLLVRWLAPAKKDPLQTSPEVLFPALNRLKKAFNTQSLHRLQSNLFPIILLALAWCFLVFALMQPERVDKYIQVKNKGYDIMLAVDISASMQALDFSTKLKTINRLDVAKESVGKFTLGRRGDRVGLVTFGESAYLHVPLTLDTLAVTKMLNDTVSGMAGNGTAIGDAIGLSVRTLRERPEGSRVIVLLTDGEDNSSSIPPMEAAKLAKQYGIRIYTIGIGRNGAVPFPTKYGTQMADVPMDEKLLKEIAASTGGHYFLATNQDALESIYTKIDEMEKSESNETLYLIREPLYYLPLGVAMSLLLMLCIYQLFNRRPVYGS